MQTNCYLEPEWGGFFKHKRFENIILSIVIRCKCWSHWLFKCMKAHNVVKMKLSEDELAFHIRPCRKPITENIPCVVTLKRLRMNRILYKYTYAKGWGGS